MVHSTTNPKLPSYVHPALREHQPDLDRAFDAYRRLRGEGVKAKYLPKEVEEPDDSYQSRLDRSVFPDFFREALAGYAGILSEFTLSSPPATFEAATDDIDREGNSIVAWLQRADTLMLRDGGVWLRVEMPAGQASSSAEEVITDRRPYLVANPRSQVINWRTSVEDGREQLEWVIVREEDEEPDDFGVKIVVRYRMIGRGKWTLYEIKDDSKGEPELIVVEQDLYLGADQNPLPICPVVWYRADEGNGFGRGELPMRQVVEHSIEHFLTRSDLNEKRRRCSMPVPWVKGRLARTGPDGQPLRMAIGPNTIVELDENGNFGFAEPSASSLSDQRQGVLDVEQLIRSQTLGFLYGESGAVKTATQAGMEGAQTESAIKRLALRKSSAMQSLMAIWCLFTGETLDPGAGLSMSSTIFERPMEAADVDQLQKLAGGVELISQRSAIEELIRRGRNRSVTSVDDELQRLVDETPEPADEPGVNDFGAIPPE